MAERDPRQRGDDLARLAGALGAASAGCATEVAGEPASGAVVVQAVTATPDIRWSVTGAGGPVAFSPDGTLVATGSTQSIAQTLSAATAARSAHTTSAPRGRDKTTANTKLWNTSGTIVRSFDDGARVFAVAFSPDGARVASNASGTIHVWRIGDGAQLVSIPNVNRSALAYSPDGRFLTTGFELFDARTGALVRRFTGQTGGVSAVTFTRDGGAVVAGGADTVAGVSTPVIRYFRYRAHPAASSWFTLPYVVGAITAFAGGRARAAAR